MPSPIAHSVTGYVLAQLQPPTSSPRRTQRLQRWWVGLAIGLANVADLDFALKFLGLAEHRGFTHSLTCAVLVSGSLALWAIWTQRRAIAARVLGFSLLVYSSHLLLDFFTAGGRGMPLLTPFSDRLLSSPQPLFPPVHHSHGLFYWGHLEFVAFELGYAAILLLLLGGGRYLYRRVRPPHQAPRSRQTSS